MRQRGEDRVGDFSRSALAVNRENVVDLEGGELRIEELRTREVARASRQASRQRGAIDEQRDERHVRKVAAQPLPVVALERRARQDGSVALVLHQNGVEPVEPRPPFVVGQRHAEVHAFDVRGIVVVVAVDEDDAERSRHHRTDGRLSRS